MDQLAIVTFLWRKEGYRSAFTADTVNALYAMCCWHIRMPFTFHCVTDTPEGLDPAINHITLWDDFADMPNPSFASGPSCYRRLKVFSNEFREIVNAERILCLDQDMVITGDLTGLIEAGWHDLFRAWRPRDRKYHVCGSMFMFRPGKWADSCWQDFKRLASVDPNLIYQHTCVTQPGSDQGWLAYWFGEWYGDPKSIPCWKAVPDGIHAFCELVPAPTVRLVKGRPKRVPDLSPGCCKLPAYSRLVIFTGKPDPWDKVALSLAPWIKTHYPLSRL